MQSSISRFASLALTGSALVMLCAEAAHAARPCPPDINCSGTVDVDDLLSVITAWGPGATGPADVNGSGAVDVDDLLSVITAWGECTFDFGPAFANAEAHQIGLEMLGENGPLTLDQPRYDRIDRDLAIIRAEYPLLAPETHTMAWVPNEMIVALFQGQPITEFNCLNVFYGVTRVDPLFTSGGINYVVVTLGGKVNIRALSLIYTAAPEVSFAEPNGIIGGQNFWIPTELSRGAWQWNIDDGFTDCFDGCDCHRYYDITVDQAGNIGATSCEEIGQEWCEFGGPGCES